MVGLRGKVVVITGAGGHRLGDLLGPSRKKVASWRSVTDWRTV